MNWLRSKFFQAVLVLVVMFVLFRFGIRPPAPWSVVTLYMTIVLIAVLVYVSSDSDSWQNFLAPIRSTLLDDSKRPLRLALMLLIPLVVGYYAYTQAAARSEAPAELRAIHPAPPASISFKGKTLDIQGLDNPLRKDAANLKKYVAEGGVIYIKNCMYCHGDNLDGAGHFAHAFNPPPANFTDAGTIAMLQEAYLFWRIAKGGPGLPKESKPWNSVMPAWEDRLSEEDIWKVIMYLYDATGYQPRRWESHAAAPHPQGVGAHSRGSLSLAFLAAPAGRVLAPPSEAQQPGDPAQGKVIYEKKCLLCHGEKGDGNGPAAPLLDPKPRDFTKGKYKIRTSASGQPPADGDLFRIISDGMPGTSMPAWKVLSEKDRWNLVAYVKSFAGGAFKDSVEKPEDIWHVANYVQSLGPGKADYATVLQARAVAGEIPDDPAAPFWTQQSPANFSLAGQVIVDPRNFNPSIDGVTVRAVYSATEIAFHLTWDDRTASKPDPKAKTFADQIALQFPARAAKETERPYVLMGDGSDPVALLLWTSDAGVGEATASGIGKIAPKMADAVKATGKAVFADGQYRLVIKRRRATKDPNELAFPVGRFLSVAFMAWDGGAGETGSRMSFSSWYYFRLEEPASATPYIVPPVVAFLIVALELLVVRRTRRGAQGE